MIKIFSYVYTFNVTHFWWKTRKWWYDNVTVHTPEAYGSRDKALERHYMNENHMAS